MQQAMVQIPDAAKVLVLYGDVPLITADSLQRLLAAPAKLAVLTRRNWQTQRGMAGFCAIVKGMWLRLLSKRMPAKTIFVSA